MSHWRPELDLTPDNQTRDYTLPKAASLQVIVGRCYWSYDHQNVRLPLETDMKTLLSSCMSPDAWRNKKLPRINLWIDVWKKRLKFWNLYYCLLVFHWSAPMKAKRPVDNQPRENSRNMILRHCWMWKSFSIYIARSTVPFWQRNDVKIEMHYRYHACIIEPFHLCKKTHLRHGIRAVISRCLTLKKGANASPFRICSTLTHMLIKSNTLSWRVKKPHIHT